MSLDVYLETIDTETVESKILIGRDGKNVELSKSELEILSPGINAYEIPRQETNFWANITHNLGKMAEEAGIYNALWRPEEIGCFKASDLLGFLADGLRRLREDPDRFKKFDPENGWGNYEELVGFVEKYLKACIDYPESKIRVSR